MSLGLGGAVSAPPIEEKRTHFFDWRVAGVALAVALAYYLGARIGFALTFQPHPVSVLWPPNSILLAALLLTPGAHLVARFAGGVSSAFGGATAKRRSAHHDSVLVHQQLVRSTHRRGLRPLFHRPAGPARSPAQCRDLLFLRRVPGAVSLLFPRRSLRGPERIWARQLLADLANSI